MTPAWATDARRSRNAAESKVSSARLRRRVRRCVIGSGASVAPPDAAAAAAAGGAPGFVALAALVPTDPWGSRTVAKSLLALAARSSSSVLACISHCSRCLRTMQSGQCTGPYTRKGCASLVCVCVCGVCVCVSLFVCARVGGGPKISNHRPAHVGC
jgi:hypothetical protein